MEGWIIWLIAAGLLLIVELLTQMMWTLFLAVGCLVSMVSSLLGLGMEAQLIVLVVSTVVAYLLLGPLLKRKKYVIIPESSHDTRTGMDALLGRKAIVTSDIKPGELGRARIDGDNWQVRAPGVDKLIPRGAEVIVTGYDSIILDIAVH